MNDQGWDRVAARSSADYPVDTAWYGPDGPSERELRLLGRLDGRRVLDLGCGSGQAAIAFARQGAIVIAVDASAGQLARARERAEREEVRVEWRHGDAADLAFLRAESIDVAFSAFVVAEVDDVARLFRQVQRVLKPNAPFVFSLEHPMGLCVSPEGIVEGSYFARGPVSVERHGELIHLYVHTVSELFIELSRAGFRVDTIAEPPPSRPGARVPTTIVFRARKEGA